MRTEDEYVEETKAKIRRLKLMLEILQKNPTSNKWMDIDSIKEEIDDLEDDLNNL